MKPAEFRYFRPHSVAEALELLAEHPDAKILAGGQSLLTLMNMRLARPSAVIDIGALAELSRIFDDTDDLILGALVTHRTVEVDPLIGARAPLLADAARYIGHIGIRNRGTIGGSVAHADPAAEMPLATLVLGAVFHVDSAKTGRRRVSAEDMFVSFYTNALEQRRDDHLDLDSGRPAASGLGIRRIRASARRLRTRRRRVHADAAAGWPGRRRYGRRCSPPPIGLCCLSRSRWSALSRHASCGLRLAHDWAASIDPSAEDADYARRLCAAALAEALTAAQRRLIDQEGAYDDS